MAQRSPTELLKLLAEIPVFAGMSAAQLGEIAQSCQIRHLAKGERVFWEGDRPRAFYHLLEGQIKRAASSPEGGEKVLEILNPVQSFGAPELFGSRPYASFAEAVRPTVLLQIAKEAVLRVIERDPRLALAMLGALADRQAQLERDAAARHLQNRCERVMDYLLELAGTQLSPSADTTVELATSKQLIAARLDLTPETLSRTLRTLSEAHLISVAGKRVTLHRAQSRRASAAAFAQPRVGAFAACHA
jgi:CRP-like cAMP-binding protein